jgi:hypothetical protein
LESGRCPVLGSDFFRVLVPDTIYPGSYSSMQTGSLSCKKLLERMGTHMLLGVFYTEIQTQEHDRACGGV